MSRPEAVDAVVFGAGPAGCTVALRLLALGYRVAVVERHDFPRPRIGEALSPGIWNLLEYLQIKNALDGARAQNGVSTRIAWERREPELAEAPQHQLGVVVDRGEFDARLLASVRSAGGQTFQPAEPQCIGGGPGAWEVHISGSSGATIVSARLILDARGRSGHSRTRAPTGPATIALWTDTPAPPAPPETRLEALERGWLWGTRLPCGRYRLMAFVDPDAIKGGGTGVVFSDLLSRSTLFSWARSVFTPPVRACSATPYIDQDVWKPGTMKLGDAALALDPLSSSGVEKAMRLALQSALVANTVLRNPAAGPLAHEFYESSLVTAAAAHVAWARGFYARAWPGDGFPFWYNRSRPLTPSPGEPALAARVREVSLSEPQIAESGSEQAALTSAEHLRSVSANGVLRATVRLSPMVRFVRIPCVVGNVIEMRLAATHPALGRPLAFLGGGEIAPLLQAVPLARSLGNLVGLWSSHLPQDVSARLAGWLVARGLIATSGER